MPKIKSKLKVTKVKIGKDSSVGSYKKDTAGLKEVMDAVADAKGWTADGEVDQKKKTIKRVRGVGFPSADGHPGHVHGSGGWKYNIERGNKTVDRLVIVSWSADCSNEEYDAKKDWVTGDVEVTIKVKILEETH
tara:strand:- start:54 stop:455 length:402 start_codon:yes stop_codon:yes gene_type:complete